MKAGKINNAAPGVFFYYTQVTAPASNFTIDVVQTNNNTAVPLFGVPQQNQINLFNADCTSSSLGTITITNENGKPPKIEIVVSGAGTDQTFVVSVKYTSGTVVGAPVPTPTTTHYDFATRVDGSTVDANTDGLDLKKKLGSKLSQLVAQSDGLLSSMHSEDYVGPYGVVGFQVMLKPAVQLHMILRRLLEPEEELRFVGPEAPLNERILVR